MNLDFVRSFYWVAKLKSVTLAAERMGVVQTAMSARIAALERELKTPLLDRRDRQVRLTPAGVRFLADAARLIELWDEIKAGRSFAHRHPRARPAGLWRCGPGAAG